MTCCGADAHPLCKAVFLSKKILVPKCPACDCHLHQNGKLHTDFCGAADYIYLQGGRREKTKFVEEWERTIHTSHLCNVTDRLSLCVLSFVTLFVLVPNRQIVFVCTFLLCNSVRLGSQPTDHLCVYLYPL